MNLLFDLDGTLTDPFEGITRSIQYALAGLGRQVPGAERLAWCIGPPLRQSFATLLATDDDKILDKALALYRERFGVKGLYENRVYKDIPFVLAALNNQGHTLFVATSKPGVYAEKIVSHFGLSKHFKHIYGSELDGTRTDKTLLIAHIMAKEGLQPSNTLMIGDRKYDVQGAVNNDLCCLGVLWGYGGKDELAASGAAMVDTPAELLPTLGRMSVPHSV